MIHRRGLVRPRSGRIVPPECDQLRTSADLTSVPNRAARQCRCRGLSGCADRKGAWMPGRDGTDTDEVRERAEELLRALAGAGCAAPGRSVAGDRGAGDRRSPGAVRAAHRVGQVGGLLHRHRPAARARRGSDRDRVAAAGADAQPDRGGGPRRHPRAHHQLGQPRRVGRDRRRGQRGRGRRPADQPGAAQQPRLPRQRAAQARGVDRAAGGRRGALHLRLGARLPARLPAAAHAAGRAQPEHRRAGHHRDGQRAGDHRRRRAA